MEESVEDAKNGTEEDMEVCRLCFGTTNVTVHIGQLVDKSTSIADKIHYCTSLVVKVGDSLYQYICTTCAENLNLTYNFKSKAIACDLELSKNVPIDEEFTYIQVSDDPLNMTYKLDLVEQDSTSDLVSSCVYNIIDGDELTIEPVNDVNETNENEPSLTESIKSDDDQTLKVISNNLKENSMKYQYSKSVGQIKTFDVKRNSSSSLMNEENRKIKKVKIENNIEDDKPSLIVKNGKVVYICGACNFEADSMAFLISHRVRFHLDNMGSFKCSKCPNIYKTSGLLKRHTSICHDSNVCEHCGKNFSSKQILERHINNNHLITPLEFQCVKCNAYFDTMEKMEDHLVIHYMDPSGIHICNRCDRSFTTYAAKNKHIDLEHMTEIECGICHVVLPTKEAMEKHNNSVHQPKKTGNKTYACTTCEKCFTDIKDILEHRKTHIKNDV